MERTEKVTYETIDGEDKEVLRIFHDGIETKKAIFPDLRVEEQQQEEEEKQSKLDAENNKTEIKLAWSSATSTDEKINVIAFVLGLNGKL